MYLVTDVYSRLGVVHIDTTWAVTGNIAWHGWHNSDLGKLRKTWHLQETLWYLVVAFEPQATLATLLSHVTLPNSKGRCKLQNALALRVAQRKSRKSHRATSRNSPLFNLQSGTLAGWITSAPMRISCHPPVRPRRYMPCLRVARLTTATSDFSPKLARSCC